MCLPGWIFTSSIACTLYQKALNMSRPEQIAVHILLHIEHFVSLNNTQMLENSQSCENSFEVINDFPGCGTRYSREIPFVGVK